MKIATIRIGTSTRAVRHDGDHAVELDADDVGEVVRRDDWRAWVESSGDGATTHPIDSLDFAPLVTHPDKIVCVGLNYASHVAEMGHATPDHPTLFAKYRGSLIGANDPITIPRVTERLDYEAELAVVIGRLTRHVSRDEAADAIAGYSVLNDVTGRDYQRRTSQFLQGKTFEATTPLGPWLVTADESPDPDREIVCEVNGDVLQQSTTADLVFDPFTLISYLSSIITLEPGDVIATGTPGGVGAARTPPRWLVDGDEVVTRIAGIGECRNICRPEPT